MKPVQNWRVYALCTLTVFGLATACSPLSPAKKPEVGPAGYSETVDSPSPFWQKFEKPPLAMYDLDTIAGALFENLKQHRWDEVNNQLTLLQQTWLDIRQAIGNSKGTQETDEALEKLTAAVTERNTTKTHEALNGFIAGAGETAKAFKLSPLTDLLLIGNAVRDVNFYVLDKDWSKAAAKALGLESTWEQNKPSLEQIGILSEITEAHSSIKAIRDAVSAENEGSATGLIKKLNKNLANIREFYKNH